MHNRQTPHCRTALSNRYIKYLSGVHHAPLHCIPAHNVSIFHDRDIMFAPLFRSARVKFVESVPVGYMTYGLGIWSVCVLCISVGMYVCMFFGCRWVWVYIYWTSVRFECTKLDIGYANDSISMSIFIWVTGSRNTMHFEIFFSMSGCLNRRIENSQNDLYISSRLF